MAKQTPRTTEADVAAAVAAVVEAKRSFRAVAKDFGVSHVQVRRWVLAWRIAHPEGVAAPEPEVETPWAGLVLDGEFTPPPPETPAVVYEPSEPTNSTDPIDIMRDIVKEIQGQIRANRKAGNIEVAGKLARDLVVVSNNLARAIKAESSSDGAIVITKDEARDIERALVRKQQAELAGRPLLCTDCGKALSVQWGTGLEPSAAGVDTGQVLKP